MKLPWLDWSTWFIPRIDWIQLEVTTRCNAACVYCPRTAYRDAWRDRSLSLATFRRLLPALKKTRLVHLQGWGEPFLHPDFFTLTAMAKEAGCRVSTTTNGMLLDEDRLRQVVASGLDIIAFSLTGLKAGHDRARPGAIYRQVLSAIQTLNRLKAREGRTTPQIHLAYLVLRSGLADLEKLSQVLPGLGVQQAVISTLDFVPTRELAGESFLNAAVAEYEGLHASLAEVAAAANRLGVSLHYPRKPSATRGVLCPENPLAALCVAADGAVSPCVFTNLPVSRATYLGPDGE
jgi:MoaA/NifB/PqqE/SkfB family radical SAM enzyme